MKKLLIINGPNLNLLGVREKEVYGTQSFEDYLVELKAEFGDRAELDYFQSNHEGALIDALHDARNRYDGVILNAGGYTHTSVALADAIGAVAACGLKTVEVHISNIAARESFRHVSMIAPRCAGSVAGFGMQSYRLAVYSFL
ncbi:MAG TPA: 3-dehydroquinate dehydratase [Candidatus Rikenella faecigallinarum]|uniref:3-dehydroquinate dehydratase n=1 Tax=Candidatus Rikenella faecigallinarum TaxID=2838745 RepID=A0A9D1TXB6_9BACT|nr:3-dehydroquinate dehydratase [Candidatus Rikenella faecigallinarum]